VICYITTLYSNGYNIDDIQILIMNFEAPQPMSIKDIENLETQKDQIKESEKSRKAMAWVYEKSLQTPGDEVEGGEQVFNYQAITESTELNDADKAELLQRWLTEVKTSERNMTNCPPKVLKGAQAAFVKLMDNPLVKHVFDRRFEKKRDQK
jgi:hypothetical protein